MAEYTSGQDKRSNEHSGYNKILNQSPKISPVNGFEEMNYEQVRAPYHNERNSGNGNEADKESSAYTGRQRGEI